MKREITWVEKLPDRVKREVRVNFFGRQTFWRERFSTEDYWNNDMVPSEEDWTELEDQVRRRMQRWKARQEELDLVLNRVVGKKRGAPSQRIGKEL